MEFAKICEYWPKTKNNATNREYSAIEIKMDFFAKLYDASFGNAKGVAPTPCPGEGDKTRNPGAG